MRGARVLLSGLAVLAGLLVPTMTSGQGRACAAAKDPVPAAMAYAKGDFADAELLYQQALVQAPKDAELTAGLARARLRQGKVAEARTTVEEGLAGAPQSAALLTARAEVELREGLPWRARRTLTEASAADPCFARALLVRSRIDRLDSMYATERREVQAAYDLDAKDPEIKRTWNQTVMPAKDITGTEEYLASQKTVDPELKKAAETSVRQMMPLLSETSQTCQGLPTLGTAGTETTTLPLQPSMQDGRHVDGYRLEVQFGQTKAMLGLDTAASGLYVSRALAEANGMTARVGDPPGTVHADTVQMGPLTFKDCVVGVSDTPFPGKAAGFIGTDLFGASLVTLNFPAAKLELAPLPAVTGYVPEDRPKAASLQGYSPVYHRLQYLLVPVTLNGKEERLFALDSGIRLSTMTLPVAHLVSSTQRNFTNPMKTTTGATFQVYRDAFDFAFADLKLPSRTGVLEFDPATIEQHVGMTIGGMLGFDMLHTAVLHLDYRDGLIKLEFPSNGDAVPAGGTPVQVASAGNGKGPTVEANTECEHEYPAEVPAAATIEARNTGLWDAGHMKAGDKVTVKVVSGWSTPECRLEAGALLYGKVTAAAGKNGPRQLGLDFEQADCFGKGKQTMPLKLFGMVAAPAEFVGMHTALPTSIGGGLTRNIGDTVEAQAGTDDQQLNPEGRPAVVQVGSVRGLPALKLSLEGGPSCSALLTSSGNTLHLGINTKFLMVVVGKANP